MMKQIKPPIAALTLALVVSLSACQKKEAGDAAASKLEAVTEHATEAAKQVQTTATDAAASVKKAASETTDEVMETGAALSDKVLEQPGMLPESGRAAKDEPPADESPAKD